MNTNLTEMEKQLAELTLTSPNVSRAIFRRYFNLSFIYDDLNEYMQHDKTFQADMHRLFKELDLSEDHFDFGKVTDFAGIPSKFDKYIIRVLVNNASSQYLKLKNIRKLTPEREGFMYSVCSAFRVLPGTKRWNKIDRYFNEEAKVKKEKQLKQLHLKPSGTFTAR